MASEYILNAADYEGWSALLAGGKWPIHEGTMLCGFWRTRNGKGGPWLPVAIARKRDGDKIVMIRNRIELIDRYALEAWLWCAKNPIAEAAYRHYEKHGVWQDHVADIRPTDYTKLLKKYKDDARVKSALFECAIEEFAASGKVPLGCVAVAEETRAA